MKKATMKAILLPLMALLAWHGSSPGQAGAQEIETREVTVTSTRAERDLFEIPMTVGVKTAEDLKWQPQTNVADFLADIPGVSIMDGSMPGGKRIMIRGESPMRSLILIDGVKVSEQKSMSGPAILVDTSQIERIELIKGPASVLYGSEAIAGVINIITKKGGDKPVGFSQNFIADSSTHSVETQTAIFGSHNGFNYRFSGSALNAGNRRTPGGDVDKSDYKNNYLTGRVGYDWDNGSFYVRADKYHSVIHIPTATEGGFGHTFDPMAAYYENTTNVFLDLPKWDRQSVSVGFEFRNILVNLTKLKLDLYYQNMKKHFKNTVQMHNTIVNSIPSPIYPILQDMIINIETINDQNSYGGILQSDWKIGDHYLIVGLDYNQDILNADDIRPGTRSIMSTATGQPGPMNFNTLSAYSAFHYKAEQGTLGLFAQDEWALPGNFTATLGLRNTWVKSSLTANDNPDLPASDNKSDTKLVGNVGLVYTGLDNISLRASWAQGYKFPPLNDLYLGTIHGSTNRTYPNPDLKPETSNNFEIGMRYDNGALNLDLAAFYSKSKNYITTRPMPIGNQFVNSDRARAYGFELGASYELYSLGLTPYATVAYIDRQTTDTIGLNTIYPRETRTVAFSTSDTGTAPWTGRLGFRYDKDLDNSFIFHSNVYMEWAASARQTYWEHDLVLDNGSGNRFSFDHGFVTDKLPGWNTYNVDLGLEWGENHKWNASLSLRNIFDQAYTRANNVIEDPGFHVVAGVGFEF
ncbi:MAG: TonB-dependent receptor [Deltaproteobacteria bacterium]|jgi:hemoglobin/transferrin/lactoferrin receptor protein|nr:TonB-dependent receptor [Deltaproteobacteria bacterium]